MRFKWILFLLCFCPSAFADITSYDYTFVANDVYSSDFHTRLNANFSKSLTGGINNITAANVTNDSLTEADMADDINPRIRTYEGASCEFVKTGLLPQTSGSLTSDITLGTAYPLGYRINKLSNTAKTYTASRWTYVDIDINGDFQYSAVSIGSAAPSIAANSIRLARVSTDGTTINTVTDLRTTSCTNGPFSNIGSGTGEPTLDDVLKTGPSVRRFSASGRTPDGFIQGFYTSWDTATTFKVTGGSAYINGEYRTVSTDTTVPISADDPANGISGIVSGSIAGATNYNVYLVADADATKVPSVSFGTSPTSLTNYRVIGTIRTDAGTAFTSRDIVTVHGINEKEVVSAWINYNGSSNVINDSFNVSSITDNGGAGDHTITFDADFVTANYACTGMAKGGAAGSDPMGINIEGTPSAGAINVETAPTQTGTRTDSTIVMVSCVGDARR